MPRRKIEDDPRSVRERQKAFLQAYSGTFSLGAAGRIANVSCTTHHKWFRKDAKYRDTFLELKEESFHYLESVAIERAGEGWLEPVFYQGAPCGEVRRFDSGLLQFLLRGQAPQKYGSKTEISGPAGEPVQARIEVVFVRPGEVSPGE
jgi:hypothetical protein